MRQSTKKLKSERGASMLFALMVFLLCLFAGVAALTAAAANVGRYTHLEQEQQQYLSVASALELVQKQMDDEAHKPSAVVKFIETTKLEYGPPSGEGTGYEYEYKETPSYELYLFDPDTSTRLGPETLTYYECQLLLQYVPQDWWNKAESLPKGPDDNLKREDVESRAAAVEADAFGTNGVYTVALAAGHEGEAWADALYPVEVTVAAPEAKTPADATNVFALQMGLRAVPDGTDDRGFYPLTAVWHGKAASETDVSVTTTSTPGPGASGTPGTPGTPLDGSYGERITGTTLKLDLEWNADNRTVKFE